MTLNKDWLRYGLQELASRSEQERLWTGLTPGVMASFVETACFVFGYTVLGAEMDSGRLGEKYGDIVCGKIRQLWELVQNFPEGLSPLDQINHPLMDEIRAAAQELLNSALFANDAPRLPKAGSG
jgi:hypothetical protein